MGASDYKIYLIYTIKKNNLQIINKNLNLILAF